MPGFVRTAAVLVGLAGLAVAASPAFSSPAGGAPAGGARGGGVDAETVNELGLWPLFVQSLDVFTVMLLIGSLTASFLIVRRAIDLRAKVLLPESSVRRVDELLRAQRVGELEGYVQEDGTMVSLAVRAALEERDRGSDAMLDAGEMAASEETARLYRSIDLLNVIGNLGPLVGLAGTVYGMILAFTSLSVTEGQAGPGDLSAGISKALFHTLLGLLLAIPCLSAFAVFRQMVDRTATRGMSAASRAVERLVSLVEPGASVSGSGGAGSSGMAAGPNPPPLGRFGGVGGADGEDGGPA
ncbi:MAG: MotA/TolQ/ExbB proton channel family protein [Planctomycetota bacterium]